ncbi:hypothetical protein DTO013E5_9316 [Penicillium roqueforti]|uniref:Uncharacterized protein n=1 Tax=Penicillium roqueforti (strain FM164) TaxID=1365484 RepID=W6QKY3_PENRF|nr:uncharacterized protein LCP9604111_9110 [Penicillium roqueforti]CDM37110.1 unnamed protein product [Penicillium roqueforti FM164]KAF9239568.1 hypothetical protein LCP9604111_9110 [Penicillium roqueforti]KAI1829679.1 hypothetical protein CBS147337_9567 [Penicillium roqueforti]KAI2669952.1 hypothetical protein CBS147355_9540 [Penicillium roqueforti]KAI2671892.1 hypothetical protein LCP963914a_9523 [Penicillium roqueforti]
MSRRRISHSEMNEALAYPFMQSNGPYNSQSNGQPRRGPIEGPNGRRLIRRVTWRSSTYKLMATLWVLAVLYIVWLVRDLFLPSTPSESRPTPPAQPEQN